MNLSLWLKRNVGWIPAVLWMAGIFWLSSQATLPPPPGVTYTIAAIAGHFLLYFGLTLLLLIATGAGPTSPKIAVIPAAAGAFVYAISDEIHQSFVPGRTPSVDDILVDSLGILFALVVWTLALRKFGKN